jgi:citrate lyase subunit beta/citryl-CoA lyase
LGFKAKCVVFPEHVAALNLAFTPSDEAVRAARELRAAYETQRRNPIADAGLWIDAPRYHNAGRLLERHEALCRGTPPTIDQPDSSTRTS